MRGQTRRFCAIQDFGRRIARKTLASRPNPVQACAVDSGKRNGSGAWFRQHCSIPYGGLACLIFSTLVWGGCAVFGPRQMSYQELEQRNRETKEKEQQILKPGFWQSWGVGK